jgi:hypothetical protein
MSSLPSPARGCVRERLQDRHGSIGFAFEFEGHAYRATASHFDDGRLAEIFLDTSKAGSAAQTNAQTAAVLVSLLLQHGVGVDAITHSVAGPIAVALELARAP